MIGKIIGIVFLLVIVYFAWNFMFAETESSIKSNVPSIGTSNNPALPSHNPATQYDNSVSSRDIVLSRENPNIPSSAWNP